MVKPKRQHKHRGHYSRRGSYNYHKMTDEDIEVSRAKIGLHNTEVRNAVSTECGAYDCREIAKSKCGYCGKEFCNKHSDPRMAATAKYVWSLDKSDYEKYNKYQEDWQRKDGHPCVAYTERWNKNHDDRINYKTVPKWGGIPTRDRVYRSSGEWSKVAYGSSYSSHPDKTTYEERKTATSKSKSDKNIIIVAVIIIVIFIIGSLIFGNAKNTNNNTSSIKTTMSLLGSQSNPFQPNANYTIVWQGPGYYFIPVNVPATGLPEGVDLLSNKSQSDGYDTWVVQLYPQTTTISTTSSTTTQSTSSTVYTTIHQGINISGIISKTSGVISSIGSSINPAINSQWVANLNANLSTYRSSSLAECSTLDQFAKIRYTTMTTGNNWQTTHYGYDTDFNTYMQGRLYGYFDEEYFYPNTDPKDFIYQLQSTAPAHWQGLISSNYSYFGYYIGQGPSLEIYQPCSLPSEWVGGGINQEQALQQAGCSYYVTNTTWFVIELSSSC